MHGNSDIKLIAFLLCEVQMMVKRMTNMLVKNINIQYDDIYTRALVGLVYRVSQEERTKLREGVPYVKLYRYNPKHLCPKLDCFRDNGK